MSEEQLQFKVSAGLKNIIGKELINNEYIAIFELVKNSYDAGATHVKISFYDNLIEIEDNGHGMTKDDIINKWLFVAYSEKKEENRKESYRDKIRPHTAGAKGIGRFSCDRLGSKLELYTKTKNDKYVNKLFIDWKKFEHNDSKTIDSFKVEYSSKDILLFNGIQGTKLVISNLFDDWNRRNLLKLKSFLRKLINPTITYNDEFQIELIVPSEENKDNSFGSGELHKKINGIIKNDIFEQLNIKTINIKVTITQNGQEIHTVLYDRGHYVYIKKDYNKGFKTYNYNKLHNINIELYYLNRQSKELFRRLMDIRVKDYGSVFVYKNNFRILPYGEPLRDVFDIDRRKAQGYNRNLGTRDLIGRVSIYGENKEFIETSSRADGFVQNETTEQLNNFFRNEVLIPLEKYVVKYVDWADDDAEKTIVSKDVVDKVLKQILKDSIYKHTFDLQYNYDVLFNATTEQKNNIYKYINQLKKYVIKKQDSDLNVENLLNNLTKQLVSINNEKNKLSQEAQNIYDKYEYEVYHRNILEQEKQQLISYNQELESQNKKNINTIEKLHNKLGAEKRRAFFLQNTLTYEQEKLMERFHMFKTNSITIMQVIKSNIRKLQNNNLSKNDILNCFDNIVYLVSRNNVLLDFGAGTLFDTQEEHVNGCIFDYISEYCEKIIKSKNIIEVKIIRYYSEPFIINFSPQDISIIIDNVVSNSSKHNASILYVEFYKRESKVQIIFRDNGIGIDKKITDVNSLFELGISYTQFGMGMGLYHIKKIIKEQLNGIVYINKDYIDGFELIVEFGDKNE